MPAIAVVIVEKPLHGHETAIKFASNVNSKSKYMSLKVFATKSGHFTLYRSCGIRPAEQLELNKNSSLRIFAPNGKLRDCGL
jgi:hypothetical protein